MIAVSAVTYKTNLKELAKRLQSLSSKLVTRIYIIDNSSMKYIADFCRQYPKVTYIGSDNVGYEDGHNQVLRQVLDLDQRYHLVLNSDVDFESEILEKIWCPS